MAAPMPGNSTAGAGNKLLLARCGCRWLNTRPPACCKSEGSCTLSVPCVDPPGPCHGQRLAEDHRLQRRWPGAQPPPCHDNLARSHPRSASIGASGVSGLHACSEHAAALLHCMAALCCGMSLRWVQSSHSTHAACWIRQYQASSLLPAARLDVKDSPLEDALRT